MSSPFYGEEFTFTQPDGDQIQVRGWGDQHYAVFETLDGFTVVKDPITGSYQYATVSDDGEELEPTGVRAGSVDPSSFGLTESLRISPEAAKAKAEMSAGLPPSSKSRWEVRRERARMALRAATLAPGVSPAPPQRETVGDYVGLCLLVQFPDIPGTISREEVDAFCNQQGYDGFGNKGSVYDYFYDISGGRLRYTSLVAPYYTTKHNQSYYTNPQIPQPTRTWELIKEALDNLKAQGFDFSQLTTDDEDYVYALNVFYAGNRVNNWAEGLWPHSYHLLTPYELTPGKLAFDYQITDMGNQLTLGTFCHENGHMICDFPDLYDYGRESRGIGRYCLMCAGGNADKRNPTQVSAYLRYQAGWAQDLTNITQNLNATISADRNEFFVYAKSNAEYFIIENRHKVRRDQALPGSGLAIWHVDELGSNNNEQMTPASHYECSLVQADGKNDLERGNNDGDVNDLFRSGVNNRLADSTQPSSKWWDRTSSGLEIHSIGPAGASTTFSATV
jgi:M6 family metalloprotease-like protein